MATSGGVTPKKRYARKYTSNPHLHGKNICPIWHGTRTEACVTRVPRSPKNSPSTMDEALEPNWLRRDNASDVAIQRLTVVHESAAHDGRSNLPMQRQAAGLQIHSSMQCLGSSASRLGSFTQERLAVQHRKLLSQSRGRLWVDSIRDDVGGVVWRKPDRVSYFGDSRVTGRGEKWGSVHMLPPRMNGDR